MSRSLRRGLSVWHTAPMPMMPYLRGCVLRGVCVRTLGVRAPRKRSARAWSLRLRTLHPICGPGPRPARMLAAADALRHTADAHTHTHHSAPALEVARGVPGKGSDNVPDAARARARARVAVERAGGCVWWPAAGRKGRRKGQGPGASEQQGAPRAWHAANAAWPRAARAPPPPHLTPKCDSASAHSLARRLSSAAGALAHTSTRAQADSRPSARTQQLPVCAAPVRARCARGARTCVVADADGALHRPAHNLLLLVPALTAGARHRAQCVACWCACGGRGRMRPAPAVSHGACARTTQQHTRAHA
jgi:hypothetical protein